MSEIISVSGLPRHYLSWGDEVDFRHFKVTVKLANDQVISSSGEADLVFLPTTIGNNWSSIQNRYGNSTNILCYQRKKPSSEEVAYRANCHTLSAISISKGSTKTISNFEFGAVSSIRKIPDDDDELWDDILAPSPYYINAKDFFEDEDRMPDAYYTEGIVPLKLFVHMQDAKGHSYNTPILTGYYFLKERKEPVFDSFVIEDTDTRVPSIVDTFHNFVQNESKLKFSSSVTLDPLDPELTATYSLLLTLNGNRIYYYSNSTGVFNVGKLNVNGTVEYTYTVTDSANKSSVQTGHFTVLGYSVPQITLHSGYQLVERWDTDANNNHVPMDDGENIWLSFEASVRSVNGLNSWTIKSQSFADDGTASTLYTIFSGEDGGSETYTRSENTVNVPSGYLSFSQLHRFDFTVVVEDWFGNTAFLTGAVDKSIGYANIEKYGVGIGMRTTADIDNKKFEVYRDYTSYFYGGIHGVTDYSWDEVDTGGTWVYGGKIYRKTFNVGSISTSSTKDVALGFTISSLINIWGYAVTTNNDLQMIPYVSRTSINNNVGVYIFNRDTLRVVLGSGATAYSSCYITIEYTKNNNVYQNGEDLHILRGVEVVQDGSSLHIS